jgi:uncharacterized membrane protein YkvA (DUF1232 family)
MFTDGTAAWGAGQDTEKADRVRREFWGKARRVAAGLPFAEDLLAAYYCAFDHSTPLQVKAALIGALAYFVLPFDFVPNVLPLVGYGDDAAVLLTAIRMVAGHMRPEHRTAARAALAEIRGQRSEDRWRTTVDG